MKKLHFLENFHYITLGVHRHWESFRGSFLCKVRDNSEVVSLKEGLYLNFWPLRFFIYCIAWKLWSIFIISPMYSHYSCIFGPKIRVNIFLYMAWFVCTVWSPFTQVHHVYCSKWPGCCMQTWYFMASQYSDLYW